MSEELKLLINADSDVNKTWTLNPLVSVDYLRAEVAKLPEDWYIYNVKGFYNADAYVIGHYNLEDTHELARFINQWGEIGASLVRYCGGDLTEAIHMVQTRYVGECDSMKEFCKRYISENYAIHSDLKRWIDYGVLADELCKKYIIIKTNTGRKLHFFK